MAPQKDYSLHFAHGVYCGERNQEEKKILLYHSYHVSRKITIHRILFTLSLSLFLLDTY